MLFVNIIYVICKYYLVKYKKTTINYQLIVYNDFVNLYW